MVNLIDKCISTSCALCETDKHDKELFSPNFNPEDLSFETFSARRLPDKIHYRMVRCQKCTLVRSNPVLDEATLSSLYQGSFFTYAKESVFAAETYARYLNKALAFTGRDIRLLEIGCGNGSFLRALKPLGIKEVCGIEPSQDAVEKAGELKPFIRVGMFDKGIYPPHHFDVICAFQVFDHISQPNAFLRQCRDYLSENGCILLINHNIDFWLARLLGESCPMIDIEHTYLYNPATFRKILERNGFRVLQVFGVSNCYPLSYWLKLTPLPKSLKVRLLKIFEKGSLGKFPIRANLGNLGIIAQPI